MSRNKRELTNSEIASLLSHKQVCGLPDGSEIMVKWATGWGPTQYVFSNKYGAPWVLIEHNYTKTLTPITHIGKTNLNTRVFLSTRPFNNTKNNLAELIKWK